MKRNTNFVKEELKKEIDPQELEEYTLEDFLNDLLDIGYLEPEEYLRELYAS